jgi:hypothetical protein
MKNLIAISFALYSFTAFCQVPSDILKSKDSTIIQFNNFLKDVQEIRSETKSAVETIENSVTNTNTQFQNDIQKLKGQVSSLEKEVANLNRIDSIVAEGKKTILSKRYELATKTILPEIIDGVVYVKGLSGFVKIEQKINLTTSPWQDKDIRSGYDKLKDWTPIFGIAGAGIPLLAKDADPKTALITGIGAMVIPQLIAWIGKSSSSKTKSTAEKIKDKVEFLNISRHAYDDLYQRKLEINSIYVSDSTFQKELEAFRDEIKKNPATNDSLMNLRIFKVQDYLTKFTDIQYQIPTYLKWTKDVISKYQTSKEIYDQIKDINTDIDKFLADFFKDFDSLSDIPTEVRRELFMPQ